MQGYERRYRRVNYQQEIELETVSRLKLQACAENISLGGLGMTCDRITAQEILPMANQLKQEPSIRLSVRLTLDNTTIMVTCGIQNSYRLAENLYSFNLKFIAFEQASLQLLDSFIEKQGQVN